MSSPHQRVYAIRYAQRSTTSSQVFYRDHHDTPMTMDYFVWAITSGSHTVVVDLGFSAAAAARRGRQLLRAPDRGLHELGIDCAKVEHVILTHLHYDHLGNHALFPRATFHVQDAEMAFYTGRNASLPSFRSAVEVDDICALVRLNYEGRVAFVDGEHEIVPGVRVCKVGGHTAGMQIVIVETARGRAVLASDAAHYYRNLEEQIPYNSVHDLAAMYQGFRTIRERATSPDLVVPGHDPLVLTRLKPVGDGIVEL
ncbi:MAG TPA: N-acyl homoserine lactonase family protein [Kofleriaceae bacterium]|jgi:glyoxylase-like metal-dependent hydrolase (beta-lactamase superfamily II)|nr:N-acyl homoserine lactonase family protein [Kofleriaceae bacterium]